MNTLLTYHIRYCDRQPRIVIAGYICEEKHPQYVYTQLTKKT